MTATTPTPNPAPPTAAYRIQMVGHQAGSHVPTGSADDLPSALNAAWALNRHTESPVEILDMRPDCPPAQRTVARLTLEWLDGDE